MVIAGTVAPAGDRTRGGSQGPPLLLFTLAAMAAGAGLALWALSPKAPPVDQKPALISVCSVAALAASFCCSAAAMDAFKALSSFDCCICWAS